MIPKFIEQRPEEGDIVKVQFADFTNMGSMIGVVMRYNGDFVGVQFGDCVRWLPSMATFFVLKR